MENEGQFFLLSWIDHSKNGIYFFTGNTKHLFYSESSFQNKDLIRYSVWVSVSTHYVLSHFSSHIVFHWNHFNCSLMSTHYWAMSLSCVFIFISRLRLQCYVVTIIWNNFFWNYHQLLYAKHVWESESCHFFCSRLSYSYPWTTGCMGKIYWKPSIWMLILHRITGVIVREVIHFGWYSVFHMRIMYF